MIARPGPTPLPLVAALAIAAACAPEPGPVRMAVLALDPGTGAYGLEVVTISSLEDVTALRGDAATPIGGARIDFDPWDFDAVPGEREFRKNVLADPGGPVEAQFVEEDGVLWPADFHTLNLATAYYNLERTRAYAIARGLDADGPLRGVTFYYFPTAILHEAPGDRPAQARDNAAWFSLLRSFLLLPFDRLDGVPLPMNLGVIAHEYGHAIFSIEALDSSFVPSHLTRWPAGAPALRLLGALEEGYADAWAAAVSADPRFAARSLAQLVGATRDLDRFDPARHCYSPAAFEDDLRAARASPPGENAYWEARKYEVGSVFATALWRAAGEPGTSVDQVLAAVFASLRAAGEHSLAAAIAADDSGDTFADLRVPLRALVAGAPDEPTRRALCRVLGERLAVTTPACAGVAPATDGCP